MVEENKRLIYGAFAGSSDPVVFWYTQEGSKRGKRNLMWDICLELKDEYEALHEQRLKLREQIKSIVQ